jgi:hypothetical protein
MSALVLNAKFSSICMDDAFVGRQPVSRLDGRMIIHEMPPAQVFPVPGHVDASNLVAIVFETHI